MGNFFDMGSHDPMDDVRFHLSACSLFPKPCDHGFHVVIPGDGRSAFARVKEPLEQPFWNVKARVRVLVGPRETPYSAGDLTLEEADQLVKRWQETRAHYIVDEFLHENELALSSASSDELFI